MVQHFPLLLFSPYNKLLNLNRFHLTSHCLHYIPPKFPFPTKSSPTPFEIFHLTPSATTYQIKERYYQLVKIYHPDVASKSNRHHDIEIAAKFKLIRDAYELLSSPSRRDRYIRFQEGWKNSRPQTPNRSWMNSKGNWNNQSRSNIFMNSNESIRNGFYSSSNSNDGWNYHFDQHAHQTDSQDYSKYTFRQHWNRDGLFTKNGIFITSVGCISLFLYFIQIWRVLPLLRSDHKFDGKLEIMDEEKIKLKRFIEPEGDERLDQEAWSKIKPIQLTKHKSEGIVDFGASPPPLVISSLTRSDSDQPSSSSSSHQNSQKAEPRLIPSSFQDYVQKQNLKSISDLKSARAAAVKPSVFSVRNPQSPTDLDPSPENSHSS